MHCRYKAGTRLVHAPLHAPFYGEVCSRCGSPIAFTTGASATPLTLAPSPLASAAKPERTGSGGGGGGGGQKTASPARRLSLRAHAALNRLLVCDGVCVAVVMAPDNVTYASCAAQLVRAGPLTAGAHAGRRNDKYSGS